MELLLARQGVIIKCTLGASIMTGNYEFYYAGGLLCRLAGQIPKQTLQPAEFQAFLLPLLDAYKPKDEKEAYLMKLLREYKVEDEYDAQMPQLLLEGLRERHMWLRTKVPAG